MVAGFAVVLGLLLVLSSAGGSGLNPSHPRAPASRDGGQGSAAPDQAPASAGHSLLSVVATLPLGSYRGSTAGPPTFNPRNGYVYVPGFYSDSVTVVNGTSVVASIPINGNATSAVFDPVEGLVYVTASNSSSVTVVNGTSVLGTVSVARCTGIPGYGLAAVDLATGWVYVPDPCSGNLTVINRTSVVGVVDLASGGGTSVPRTVTYSPATGYVYVADPASGNLYVVNGTKLSSTLSLGTSVNSGTYDSANGWLYVTDTTQGVEVVVSGTTVVGNVSFGGTGYAGGGAGPASFDSANGLVYVPFQGFNTGHGSVAIINGTRLVADLDIGPLIAESTSYGAFGSGTGYVYETSGESLSGGAGVGTLFAIAGTSVAGNASFPSEPVGAVYDPDNGYVYVPTYTPANVTTGLSADAITVVACALCVGVQVAEVGAPADSTWSLTAVQAATEFAETVQGTTPAPLTLNLTEGTYALRVVAPVGVTLTVTSPGATYNQSNGSLVVGSTGPGSGPGPGSARPPNALTGWLIAAGAGGLAGAVVVTAAWSRRRLRRDGEELIEGIRGAVREPRDGPKDPRRA